MKLLDFICGRFLPASINERLIFEFLGAVEMVKFIKIKARKKGQSEMYFRGKNRWGDNRLLFDLYIKRSQPLLIFGSRHSGKSENLQKIIDSAGVLFGSDNIYLTIRGTQSVAAWCRCDAFQQYIKEVETVQALSAGARNNALVRWCINNVTVIFVDDYDKLSDAKRDLVEQMSSDSMIIATHSDDSLPLELLTNSFHVADGVTTLRLSAVRELKFMGRMWYGCQRIFKGLKND